MPKWIVASLLLLGASALAAGTTPSSISLTSSASSVILGQTVTFAAAVTPAGATGKVTFYDGVAVLGVGSLSNGAASFKASVLAAGNHSITALYAGDTQYQASKSPAIPMFVSALAANGFQSAKTYGIVSFNRTIVVADFDGDGHADLAATDFDINQFSVLLNNGDGTFQPAVSYATQLAPFDIVSADFNGDGHPDIAVSNGAIASSSVSVFLNNGNGTFKAASNYSVGINPVHLATADFNGDGVADLVTSNFTDNTITVLLGSGDGTFRTLPPVTVGASPLSIVAADFNGDGNADVAVTVGVAVGGAVNVLLGNGNGTFRAPSTLNDGATPSFLTAGDFNGDGLVDLAVANGTADNISVLLGKPGGLFAAPVNYSAPVGIQTVTVGDFNGDGFLDLIATDSTSNNVNVLINLGDGTFRPAVSYPAGASPIFVAVGDFNGDGSPDLAVADFRATTVNIMLGVPVPQPVVAAAVNGASFLTGGLAPGLIFTVAGLGLGPTNGANLQLDSSNRIANKLSGVQLLVDGVPAPLIYAGATQINAIAPYELANKIGQTVKVQVVYQNVAGNVIQVPVVPVSPAIFSLGGGQGAIINQDGTVNGSSNPAKKGAFVSIYATGEGQTIPPGIDGVLIADANTHPASPITATVANVPATVQFQGSTIFYGFLQVNIQIPGNVPSGADSVVLTTSSVSSPSNITVAVQ